MKRLIRAPELKKLSVEELYRQYQVEKRVVEAAKADARAGSSPELLSHRLDVQLFRVRKKFFDALKAKGVTLPDFRALDAEADKRGPTMDDAHDALKRVIKLTDTEDIARDIMEKVGGAPKLSLVDPSKYAAIIKACEKWEWLG